MFREVVAQRLHPFLIRTWQIDIGDRVEPDEVYTALQALQQFDNLTGMHRCVVKSCETDILERTTALMGEVVLAQQLYHLGDRHLALGWHQLLSLFGQRRVHRDSHMTLTLFEEAFQLALDTHTAHRDTARTPGIPPLRSEHLRSPKHVVEVIHRLSLTHKYDIRQTLALRQGVDLIQNITCRETAFEALLTRLAEQAVHLTAHLTRHTKRGTIAIGDIDCLDEF